MSWSFSFTAERAEDIAKEFAAARDAYFAQGHWATDEAFGESYEQSMRACDSAVALAAAVGQGNSDTGYSVTVSGHANPGHAHRQGWSDEAIHVNVSERLAIEAPTEK